MANLNKVILIGRIVADPDPGKDIITFQGGGKVTKLRFVVSNSKFDKVKQEWTDEPVWLDLKFFNRGEFGKLADRAEKLRKPQQICLEGHLVMEEWTDKDGQKRSKILVYVDSFQMIDRRDEAGGGGGYNNDGASAGGGRPAQRGAAPSRAAAPARSGGGGYNNGGGNGFSEESGGDSGGEDDIPF